MRKVFPHENGAIHPARKALPMKCLEGFRKEIPYALRHGAGPYVLVIDAKGHGRKE